MSCPYAEYNNREDMSNDEYNTKYKDGFNTREDMINEHNNLKNTIKDMYNNPDIFKEKYNKLPKVMFYLSSNLFNIPNDHNLCIYLQQLYTELEQGLEIKKVFLTELSEEKIKHIKNDNNYLLIPAGIDYEIYKMMLRNELTDIILDILKKYNDNRHQ